MGIVSRSRLQQSGPQNTDCSADDEADDVIEKKSETTRISSSKQLCDPDPHHPHLPASAESRMFLHRSRNRVGGDVDKFRALDDNSEEVAGSVPSDTRIGMNATSLIESSSSDSSQKDDDVCDL